MKKYVMESLRLMKKKLSKSEEIVMDYLWKCDDPQTITDIEKGLTDENISTSMIYKAVQNLTDTGYLRIAGVERQVKSYARKLEPEFTRVDYMISELGERGIDKSKWKNLTVALLGDDTDDSITNDQLIAELEQIIKEYKGR